MSAAACKAAIDGAYLVAAAGAARDSKEVQKVFDSPGGSALVFEIGDRCGQLADMINAALRPKRE